MELHQPIEETKNLGCGPADVGSLVEAALRFGVRRDLILGTAFANPAWEIMLRLYSAGLKGRDLAFDTLVAPTERSNQTRRWLDALVQDGLVAIASRRGVPLVRLTTHGKASMDALFASAQVGTAVS